MIHDISHQTLLDKFEGNHFQVVIYISRVARQLSAHVYDVIRGSEALSWAISKITPENLDKRIHDYLNNTCVDNMIEYNLESVWDDDVKDAVRSTIHTSLNNKHLIYVYGDVIDTFKQSRVRILSNMIWEYIIENTI